MSTKTHVTRKQAEAVLAAVLNRHDAYLRPILREDGSVLIAAPTEDDRPQLVEDFQGRGHYAVVWESGPDEWAYRFTMGGVDEDFASELHGEFGLSRADAGRLATESPADIPARLGVQVEAWCSCILSIHEA